MTRAVIADDERLLREQLRARLAEVWPELEIIGEAKNGAEAVALTAQHRPDIVFLDIRMPGMTGIEAARAIAQLPVDDEDHDPAPADDGAAPWHGPEIVFITAYDQYAIQAFEQGVVDYVLKPAERERLQVTVGRLKDRLAQRRAGEPPDASGMQQLLQKLNEKINPGAIRLRWIQATVGASIQMIPVEDVLFFISDEKYTRVQTATLEALIRKPIKELVEELDADLFWQIHRSTLVNTRMIAGVTRDLRGRQLVAVRGHPEKLEVSRSYAGLFKGM
jgi:DNA-binding LytR/AlgR family response regulator